MKPSALKWISFAAAIALAVSGCSSSSETNARGVTPTTHEDMFPIASGTHGGLECKSCHGDGDSFTQVSCTSGCHNHDKTLTDPFHDGVVAGYSYGPRTCLQCHPRGESLGFNHDTKFPISTGQVHQNVACATCHTDLSNRKVFECTGCHVKEKTPSLASNMDARHAVVPTYEWKSTSCYACHPDAKVSANSIDHSSFFPIALGTKHQGISCATCHTTPGDRTVFDCTNGCHAQADTVPRHNGVPNFQWTKTSCYGCHPQANVVGLIDHSGFFPIATGSKHANISCATCHTDPTNRAVFSCTNGCHLEADTSPRHNGVPNYQWKSQSCYQCHPDSNVVGLIDHTPFFPTAAADKHANISCASCHVDPANRKNVSCANSCHPSATMQPAHGPVGGYAFSSATCLKCHADSQVDRVSSHLPFRIISGYKHYRTSCFECHPSARTDKPYGIDFALSKTTCTTSCHPAGEMNDHHSGFAGYSYTTTSCLQSGCHANGTKP